jgi:exosortase
MPTLSEVRQLVKFPALPRLTVVTCLAVGALFLPTFYKLCSFGWDNADYSHGPLILAASLWLLWRKREELAIAAVEGASADGVPFNLFTLLLLLFGSACYLTGAVHGSMAIESFSMVPLLLGAGGFLLGRRIFKALLFPVCFLLFLVPPPLALTDMLTSPLKMFVATASASLLKGIGYLVTRNGATIFMSDYSITVGDPCSGMRSLIALTSVGALYAHLLQSSRIKKSVLFLSTVPISVLANIVRLMILCLITYHFGEAAAEGFLHKFSGFVLFVVSLGSLFLLDIVMHRRVAK